MVSLKWGILGLGKIAHSFAKDAALLQDHEIIAVASRNQSKATEFANEYGVLKAYNSYLTLCQDENVDIIYIATPHDSHMEYAIMAMENGKHVLCEKPFGVNESQVSAMIQVAMTNQVFLMEAFWSRFIPCIMEVLAVVKSGIIGDVRLVDSNFAFPAIYNTKSRLFSPELAGGALLDIGIYPVFLSYLLLGMPESISASAKFSDEQIDLMTNVQFEYPNAISNIYCSLEHMSDMKARIQGTKGNITINSRWHEAISFDLEIFGEEKQTIQKPKIGKGYAHEMIHCKTCLDRKQLESPLWNFGDNKNMLRLLDSIRKKIGLKYPFEK